MKRIAISIVLFFTFLSSVNAQVILMDSDEARGRTVVEGEVPFIPTLGVTYDQYAPLSGGAMLLSGLGLVYLIRKSDKRKRKQSVVHSSTEISSSKHRLG